MRLRFFEYFTLLILSLFLSSCDKEGSFREVVTHKKNHDIYRKKLELKLGMPLPRLKKLNYPLIMGRRLNRDELELGRLLFNDTILSRNNDVSCATCHLSNHGFADGNSLTVGAGGVGGPHGDNIGKKFGEGSLSTKRSLGDFSFGHVSHQFMFRNSLSTLNVGYRVKKANNQGLFWDGRFGSLFFQVLLPIHTPEEMCGTNPIVLDENGKNPFAEGGLFFPKPVRIDHANSYDEFTGRDSGNFNAQPITIKGIPYRRRNNQISIPNRNECLALALSKVSQVPRYQKLFKKAYGKETEISDKTLAMALQAFLMTHVADNSPYDQFIKGKNSMSLSELKGMVAFFLDVGETLEVENESIRGAGCYSCHSGGQFGGEKYAGIGVKSDFRSSTTRVNQETTESSGFFDRRRTQRGELPNCHIKDKTSISGFGPDMGHASVSLNKDDCFKLRVPPLRNVIETFPYFHHGTGKLRGRKKENFFELSYDALKEAIDYHLAGIENIGQKNRLSPLNPYYDPYEQRDVLIPIFFISPSSETGLIKADLTKEERDDLYQFVAFSLWDKDAVKKGSLGNDISHPKYVPSGLTPSITRDNGHQLELVNGQKK